MRTVVRWSLLVVLVPILLAISLRLVIRSSTFLRMQIAVGLMGWDGVGEIAREAFAQRWLGPRSTASRVEFLGLLDALAEADEKYLSPTGRAVVDPDDIAEGHKYLTHLLRTGFETLVELDSGRPVFRKYVSADRKILGDNPDALYYCANLDANHTYLVTGSVTGEDYFSLTVYTAPCEGCFFKTTIADANDRQLKLSSEKRAFAVFISTTPPPESFQGDWMSLSSAPEGGSLQLVTRHYYEALVSVAVDPSAPPVNISIALADSSGNPKPNPKAPVPTDAEMSRKLRAVKMFVAKHSTELEQDPAEAPSWFSFVPNTFGDPRIFRDVNTGGVGAVDIAYSAAPFKLGADEALVIEGAMPPCAFANVVLWNRYLQTFDYADRATSLNRKQMHLLAGGRFRVILSHRDPGTHISGDWLDTMGRPGGTVFWRFLLPETEVERPVASVVRFSELAQLFPANRRGDA